MGKKSAALLRILILVFTLTRGGKSEEQPSMYAQTKNWAYLETEKTADADVFFICQIVYGGEDSFNMFMDDEATNMEKGIYDQDARFFAPYYQQAGLKATPCCSKFDKIICSI